jgi:hypothetical protein
VRGLIVVVGGCIALANFNAKSNFAHAYEKKKEQRKKKKLNEPLCQ